MLASHDAQVVAVEGARGDPRHSNTDRANTRATPNPSCVSSLTCQSCRLVRSQNSTASLGSKPGCAIVAGSKRNAQTTSVRSGASGLSVMHHHVIGMQAQQQRREDRVVVDALQILAVHRADRRIGARSAHRERASRLTHLRIPAEKRAFGEVVAAAVGWRELVELRMNERTVIALRIVHEDQLPVAREVVRRGSPRSASRRCSNRRSGRSAARRPERTACLRRQVHEHEAFPKRRLRFFAADTPHGRIPELRPYCARLSTRRRARRSRRDTDTGSSPQIVPTPLRTCASRGGGIRYRRRAPHPRRRALRSDSRRTLDGEEIAGRCDPIPRARRKATRARNALALAPKIIRRVYQDAAGSSRRYLPSVVQTGWHRRRVTAGPFHCHKGSCMFA